MPITTGPFPVFMPGVDPGGGGPTAVSDNFNRADGALGSNWTPVYESPITSGNTVISGNKAVYSSNTPLYGRWVYWSANAFSNDQYSEAKVSNGSDCILLRCATTNNATYYRLIQGSGSSYDENNDETTVWTFWVIDKIINGTTTNIYTGDPWNFEIIPGSGGGSNPYSGIVRFEVVGTTLSIYVLPTHGGTKTLDGTVTDSSISTGKPGMAAGTAGLDDWYGGDL